MALKPLSAIECNPIKMTLPISAEKKEEGVYNYSWKPDWPGPIRAPVVTTYIHSEAWSLTSPSSSFVLPTKCSATESSTFEQVISIMQTYHLRWNEHRLYSSCVTPTPSQPPFCLFLYLGKLLWQKGLLSQHFLAIEGWPNVEKTWLHISLSLL